MVVRSRLVQWCVGLTGLLLAVIVVSASIGPVDIHPVAVAKSMLNAVAIPTDITFVQGGEDSFAGILAPWELVRLDWAPITQFEVPETHQDIVVHLRLPRIILAAIVGFALAGAGTVMQGFFRNPLADPAVIGVSSGAAVGAVLAISTPALLPFGLGPAAFIGGIGTAFLVYLIATEDGRTPVPTLLLAGVAIQTFLGAVISYLILHSGDSLQQVVYWLMGHLHNSTWPDVLFAAPMTLGLFGLMVLYARDLNVLLLGEEDAQTLGVAVERTKRVLLALSSAITAAAVAVSGVIGFVGLIVPHMLRLVVGPDHRILLPTAALGGASFLVIADTIARTNPVEVPVGIVTAAVGAPFFLYLLKRRRVHAL